MKIGFWETLPILQNKAEKELSSSPFREKIFIEKVREEGVYDLVLCDKSYFPSHPSFESRIYLIPGSAHVPSPPEKGVLLTGGMNREDGVSFSSIGEKSAFLCLEREIFLGKKSIVPFETKVPFDRNFSLYKNIAWGFAQALITLFFTEEL